MHEASGESACMRMLDLDLDFFVRPAAHWRSDDGDRLPEADYEVWSPDAAADFVRQRCLVTERLPGWAIEHHDEAFATWRTEISSGFLHAPFHVTHLDAHADLGLGDAGYIQLMTHVMQRPVADRSAPDAVEPAINFSNWLAFAVACRWISDLDYVYGPGGGSDMFPFHMNDDHTGLEMKAATREQIDSALNRGTPLRSEHADPIVPLRQIREEEFQSEGRYDAITVCRSPGYTPPSADRIFDRLVDEFVDLR